MPHLNTRLISYLLLTLFALLLIRLSYVTLHENAAGIAMAQNQRLSTIDEIEYRRGDFLDRNSQPLTNRPENVLLLWPNILLKNSDDIPDNIPDAKTSNLAAYLAAILKKHDIRPATSDGILPAIKTATASYQPLILARSLLPAQVTAINQELADNPNAATIHALTLRPRYSANHTAAHLLGYAAADSTGVYHGMTGLEKQYDSVLTGRSSARIALARDSHGQPAGNLRYLAANNKDTSLNVRLTLDQSYQTIAETALGDHPGAVVLMDVTNGDVLAMASSPDYNQYLGQPPTDGDAYLNKALSCFPPASVFKTVLALAALDNNISIKNISENTSENTPDNNSDKFICTGSITIPTNSSAKNPDQNSGHTVNCWQHSGHGAENMSDAIANSCNPYFVALGQNLGGDLIREYAYRLGFAEQPLLGFSTPEPVPPDFNSAVPADVANASIGEKGIRATPLMIARLMATIANGGKMPTPRLVSDIQTERGVIVKEFPAATPRQVVKTESANQLRQMLINAVANGTGKPAASDIISIAGKTGTSQNFGVWFAGFFPADTPRWSIAVYVADGNSGGSDAGSICHEIAEKIALLENITNQSAV